MDERHLQPFGIVHGGVHCGVVETVASLGAALVFGAALIADSYWPHVNNPLGLDLLFTLPNIVKVAAAAVMASGPLRAAARRGHPLLRST